MTEVSNLPRDTYQQYKYPRMRGYSIGDDGEVTVHICVGLPCCGLDLLVEHPPDMPAVEIYRVFGEFFAMAERVRELPAFSTCVVERNI